MSHARRRQAKRGRRLGAVAVSTAAHGAILFALLLGRSPPPRPPESAPLAVTLIDMRPVATPVVSPAPTPTPRARPEPRRSNVVRSSIARAVVNPPADVAPAATATGTGLTAAQLAGAATADSGGAPGGACDMARRLQSALRKDPLVQAAVAHAAVSAGGAIMVWDGDWVQSQSEDGKGLAAVREAMTWEIAFAPEACRSQPMRGLILLSMDAAPGSARLAVGLGDWRWSDLLKSGQATPGG